MTNPSPLQRMWWVLSPTLPVLENDIVEIMNGENIPTYYQLLINALTKTFNICSVHKEFTMRLSGSVQ